MGKMWGKALALIVVVGSVVGCSEGTKNLRYGIDPSPDKMAAFAIDESFTVNKNQITILKSALDKEFLFQGNMMSLREAVQFKGLKSRVVTFAQRGDKVVMLESTKGNMVNNDYQAQLPLIEFDVIAETPTSLTLDFNKGLSRLYLYNEWYAHDSQGKDYEGADKTIKAGLTYIDQVTADQNQNLVIKQIARIDVGAGAQQTLNFEMRFYVTPYHPDAQFEPTESNNFQRFGYFEAFPILKMGGETLVNATKWNIHKPIVYAISDTTPEQYKQAIRNGVLYWNKILGENRVQVVDAPKGVSAPDYNYNVIQWVNFENAGFAYADAQVDPRSGETLHAQVFLTSSFAVFSKANVRVFLRRIKSHKAQGRKEISIQGFESDDDCDIQSDKAVTEYLETLASLDVSDERIQQISQDYMSMIVAHEVGHTMGLRHNFAGSLALSLPVSEQSKAFGEYVKTGTVPADYIPSSSVMDYMSSDYEAMMGARLRLDYAPLAYDQKAIEHLYLNKDFEDKDVPFFCTDSQVGEYVDCQRFDAGTSPVEYVQTSVKSTIERLPKMILERLIYWKIETQKHDEDILTVFPAPKYAAATILDSQEELQGILKSDFKLLQIRRKFAFTGFINKEEVEKAQDEYLDAELKKYGGLEKVLEPFEQNKPEFVKQQLDILDQAIASREYNVGKADKERDFNITNDEIAAVRKYAQSYFEKVFDELKKAQLSNWSTMLDNTREDSLIADSVVDFLAKEQQKIVFSEKPKKILNDFLVSMKNDKNKKLNDFKVMVTVLLPDFVYDLDTRVLAAGLFKLKDVEDLSLAVKEQETNRTAFNKMMENTLKPLENYTVMKEDQNRAGLRWILENEKVKAALGSPSGAKDTPDASDNENDDE